MAHRIVNYNLLHQLRYLKQFEFVRQLSKDPTNTVIGLVRDKDSTEKKITSELNQPKNVYILEADMTNYAALKASALHY